MRGQRKGRRGLDEVGKTGKTHLLGAGADGDRGGAGGEGLVGADRGANGVDGVSAGQAGEGRGLQEGGIFDIQLRGISSARRAPAGSGGENGGVMLSRREWRQANKDRQDVSCYPEEAKGRLLDRRPEQAAGCGAA